MTENEVYEALTEVFHDIFADDTIALKPETNAEDIDDWDSFNHLNILAATEERFHIKLLTKEIDGLTNVGDIVKLVLLKSGRR